MCIFLAVIGSFPALIRYITCSLPDMIQLDIPSSQTRAPEQPSISAYILDHSEVQTQSSVLTSTEYARLGKLFDPDIRLDLERSFAAVRTGLSNHLGQAKADIVLEHDTLGAPSLRNMRELYLSISRTVGWSAFATSHDKAVGIDIEKVRDIDWRQMLPMMCSASERKIFSGIADDDLLPFYRLWTIKEAIMKAAGQGFRMGAPTINLSASLILGKTVQGQVSHTDRIFDISCFLHGDIVTCVASECA